VIVISLLSSCKNNYTLVYYNDTVHYDDGEIWGTQLNLFFEKSSDVKMIKVESKKLSEELKRIKNTLVENNELLKIDDGVYDYAFITDQQDTLYSNIRLEQFRYKNFKSILKNSLAEYVNNGFPSR
jgi:hypothetical protein